jgi:hypothetical protein
MTFVPKFGILKCDISVTILAGNRWYNQMTYWQVFLLRKRLFVHFTMLRVEPKFSSMLATSSAPRNNKVWVRLSWKE